MDRRLVPSRLAELVTRGYAVRACAFAAVDAYWQAFVRDGGRRRRPRRDDRGLRRRGRARIPPRATWLAVLSALFVVLVSLVIGAWMLDSVYGLRAAGSLLFLGALYRVSIAISVVSRRRNPKPPTPVVDASS